MVLLFRSYIRYEFERQKTIRRVLKTLCDRVQKYFWGKKINMNRRYANLQNARCMYILYIILKRRNISNFKFSVKSEIKYIYVYLYTCNRNREFIRKLSRTLWKKENDRLPFERVIRVFILL